MFYTKQLLLPKQPLQFYTVKRETKYHCLQNVFLIKNIVQKLKSFKIIVIKCRYKIVNVHNTVISTSSPVYFKNLMRIYLLSVFSLLVLVLIFVQLIITILLTINYFYTLLCEEMFLISSL